MTKSCNLSIVPQVSHVSLLPKYKIQSTCILVIRPFPSSSGPLYQNEVKCSAFDMEMIFYSHAN